MLGIICESHPELMSAAIYNLDNPHGMCVENGLVYVCDTNHHRVTVLSTTGEYVGTIGLGMKGHGGASLNKPWGIDVSTEHVYITDRGNNCVKVSVLLFVV